MFQDNLKALRKEKGITQEELAARLNVVRQTVSKWEKGLFRSRLGSVNKAGGDFGCPCKPIARIQN